MYLFTRLFHRLVERWKHYQDVPRDPERIPDLADARAALDEVRNAIAEVRESIEPARPAGGEKWPRIAVDEDEYRRLRVQAVHPEG